MFTIITENDESQWDDVTGEKYHFPKRYIKFLQPGTRVVYYKGKLTNKIFRNQRLSSQPHYFGIADIENVEVEKGTTNFYASLKNYIPFIESVPFKINNKPLELIPKNQERNYWRNGVRPITDKIYNSIIHLSDILETALHDQNENELVTVYQEGGKKKVFTTVYERDRKARSEAIFIHGYTCQACGFDFKETYGEWGDGYIHVHHKNPLSGNKEKTLINPKTDLVVVCANCHSMIHRKRDTILKMEELKKLLHKNKK